MRTAQSHAANLNPLSTARNQTREINSCLGDPRGPQTRWVLFFRIPPPGGEVPFVNVCSCPIADKRGGGWNVRFVPEADIAPVS